MINGNFYYLSDKYFQDFQDESLMTNKETINGHLHGRPCFYAFKEASTGLFWLIPISSQVEKYHRHYDKKIEKYGRCDTLVFGEVLGREKAFLIQNMCPATESYIQSLYIDSKSQLPVRVDGRLEEDIAEKAKKVLALQRKGHKLIFPDVISIEKKLLS